MFKQCNNKNKNIISPVKLQLHVTNSGLGMRFLDQEKVHWWEDPFPNNKQINTNDQYLTQRWDMNVILQAMKCKHIYSCTLKGIPELYAFKVHIIIWCVNNGPKENTGHECKETHLPPSTRASAACSKKDWTLWLPSGARPKNSKVLTYRFKRKSLL